MSPISPPVKAVLEARQDATRTKIDIALLGQNLDNQQETGDLINQMVQQAGELQKQLSSGHIDVRV
ncbi:MAG: hypothetical protein AAGD07_03550 [Planctomycetota bacterium]